MLRLLSCTLLLALATVPALAQSPLNSSDFVRVKGGPELHGPTRLVRSGSGDAAYLVLRDSAHFALSDVTEFQAAGIYYQNYGVNTTNTSVVHVEEFLLQRVEEGPLDLYVHANREAPDPDSNDFDYFSVGGERPQLASSSNLRTVLGDYPESAEALRRAEHFGRIQYGAAIAGGAILAYGLVRPFFGEIDNEGKIPGFKLNLFQAFGLSTMLYSLEPRHRKKQAWRDAVTSYQNQ